MMSKEFLKKLGIFGVSFGLIASPLAFADFHEEEEQEGVPQEETAPDAGGNAEAGAGVDSTTEYENEEEEFEYEEEEFEYEEEEWEEEGDDEEQGW
ncbi:hypothetical protein [Halomonas sp. LBP4]|uniref:hypothetical protein n=1 Tax=Halomonas sp. LBP4 TaxID=2044917 RepID=UPI000D757BD2|nr:hypothetical protein [Halomonas sp. LBP4]PXX96247.1 hypothetical protein CR157_13510 [Halomonas sp. LBP4]